MNRAKQNGSALEQLRCRVVFAEPRAFIRSLEGSETASEGCCRVANRIRITLSAGRQTGVDLEVMMGVPESRGSALRTSLVP
jgi:hypothetical protein